MKTQQKAVFNAAAADVLDECAAICEQRGGEYQDSWHLDNQVTTFVDHVLRCLSISNVTKEEKRLLIMAALVDVKDSRMQGPFKRDTIVDGVNYRAAFGSLMKQYLEGRE